MNISVIFISTFVLINVLKYQSARYLLVDVQGNDLEPRRPVDILSITNLSYIIILNAKKNIKFYHQFYEIIHIIITLYLQIVWL